MDAIDSLKDLLGRTPQLWTLRLRTEYDATHKAWHVRLRVYHLARSHACNVSPEAAEALGLQYDRKTNAIAFMTRAPDPIAYHVVAKLSARLYDGDPRRIDHQRME